MTSLLCVLILNNREGHNIFGNNHEPSQSDLMKALQLQHLDLMKALQLQRAQKDGMAHLKRKTTAIVLGNKQEPTQVDLFRAHTSKDEGVHHRTRHTASVTLNDEATQEESINRETPDGVAWLMVRNSQHHDFLRDMQHFKLIHLNPHATHLPVFPK